MSEFSKAHWEWHHGEAAEEYRNSPKWTMVGKAMASEQRRNWKYAEVDQAVICLWPLLKRYNWTYRDLLNFVRRIVPQPESYPCEREQDFATYCTNVLALRKAGTGRTAPDERPTGWQVALRLLGKSEDHTAS